MQTSSISYFRQNSYCLHDNSKPPVLVAWKLRTPENYGNLIRLADNTGCLMVLFVVDEEKLSQRKIRKTAGDSFERVKIVYSDPENWRSQIPDNYRVIGLETYEHSQNIYHAELPRAMALLVGNEKRGIEKAALEQCEKIVHIPLTGVCTSLNVSHAAAIALFEWLRQNHC